MADRTPAHEMTPTQALAALREFREAHPMTWRGAEDLDPDLAVLLDRALATPAAPAPETGREDERLCGRCGFPLREHRRGYSVAGCNFVPAIRPARPAAAPDGSTALVVDGRRYVRTALGWCEVEGDGMRYLVNDRIAGFLTALAAERAREGDQPAGLCGVADELESLIVVRPAPARTALVQGLHSVAVIKRAVAAIRAALRPARDGATEVGG